MSTFIPAGDDKFETTNNGETFHNFAGSPIPAGFFNFDGAGTSHAYSGNVPLEGVPLPGEGMVDTVIHRNQNVWTPGTTSITITKLSLRSISPITVTYSDRPSETWIVKVGLSTAQASTGSMTINDGGTFDSTLSVFPRFTFVRTSDLAEKVLDTGGGSGLMATSSSLTIGDSDDTEIEPAPEPQPVPCKTVSKEFESTTPNSSDAAAASCPPVRLTSTNSPWQICDDGSFCIPRPITEQELLASHNASPKGTKQVIIR
jgi:hypothetical protein